VTPGRLERSRKTTRNIRVPTVKCDCQECVELRARSDVDEQCAKAETV